MQCHGVPEYVLVSGRVSVDDGLLKVAEGYGRFINTTPFAPYIYNPDKLKALNLVKNGVDEQDIGHQLHKVIIHHNSLDIFTYFVKFKNCIDV